MTIPKRLLFLGSKEAGLKALQRLLHGLPQGTVRAVLCPDDRSDLRCEYEGFLSLARQNNLPLHLVQTTKETVELIGHYSPQTVIVHGWYRMIPIAQFPSVEFLGFHYSPLPMYRGNAPLVWQIINGEEQLGVSFFVLTEGMDDGDLVDQTMFELTPHEDVSDAIRKANECVSTMLDRFIPRWLEGEVTKRRQPALLPSYCGLRIPEDGRIDWRADATRVHNFIRAQTRPYPGAFSLLGDGRIVRFWRSGVDSRRFHGAPGAVIEIAPDFIVIACGVGAVKILHASVDGETPASAPSAMRSLKVRLQ